MHPLHPVRSMTLFALIVAAALAASCAPAAAPATGIPLLSSLEGRTMLDGEWKYAWGDDPEWADPDFDDSSFPTMRMPEPAFSLKEREPGTFFWMRKAFELDGAMEGVSPGLHLGKLPEAVQVFLNGSLVMQSGLMPPDPLFSAPHAPRSLIVPAALLRPGQRNVLAYRVLVIREQAGFFAPYFCSERDRLASYLAILTGNSAMSIVATALALCVALYFLVLGIRSRPDRISLWLVAAFTGLAVYFSSVYLEWIDMPYLAMVRLQFAPLHAGVACFTIYFQSLFKVNDRWPFKLAAGVLGGGAALAVLFLTPDMRSFELVNGGILYIFPLFIPLIVYIFALTVIAMRRRLPYSVLYFAGISAAIATGIRDMLYVNLRLQPDAWIFSWGMMGFILAIFFASALRVVDAKKEASLRGAEAERRAAELDAVLSELRGIGEEVAESGKELEAGIAGAAESVKALVDSGAGIREKLGEQASTVEESGRTIARILSAFGESAQEAERQAADVAEAGSAVETLADSISLIWKTTQSAAEIATKLSQTASSGQGMAAQSSQAIRDIERSSAEVRDIVQGIREISDRTNILAMNAAIEAAHAGEAGKGFAVVADEVRSLSEMSRENAQGINAQMDGMSAAIESGVALFDKLATGFEAILKGARETADLVERIAIAANEQNEGAGRIGKAMDKLVAASERLREQSERQKREGEAVRASLEGLGRAASAITGLLGSRSEAESDMSDVTEGVRHIAANNKAILERLQRILEASQGRG